MLTLKCLGFQAHNRSSVCREIPLYDTRYTYLWYKRTDGRGYNFHLPGFSLFETHQGSDGYRAGDETHAKAAQTGLT